MRHGKQIRPASSLRSRTQRKRQEAFAAPPRARGRHRLEVSRASLLGLLVREPAVCRSVGLVR